MAKFLVRNPKKFRSETLVLPAIVCCYKLFINVAIEGASITLLIYYKTELDVLKFYTFLSIVQAIEARMVAILGMIKVQDEMKEQPLETWTV